MPTYKIIENAIGSEILSKIGNDGVEWFIPLDPANSDYQAYLADEAKTK